MLEQQCQGRRRSRSGEAGFAAPNAREALDEARVPKGVGQDLIAALLRSTVKNLERLEPAEALTGPAARRDHAAIEAQGRDVAAWHTKAGQLYTTLGGLAARLKKTGFTLRP